MKTDQSRTLFFLVHDLSNDNHLFLNENKMNAMNIQYSPIFDPWDNFAGARYFYQLFNKTVIIDDDAYVKMIQEENFKEILGVINDAQVVKSSRLQKVFLLEFEQIPPLQGILTLTMPQILTHLDQFNEYTQELVLDHVINKIHSHIEPIYICQLNPSPFADKIMKNIEEGLHRGFHQEQNEIWVTYKVAFGEFPTFKELEQYSSVIINGSCCSVNDESLDWIPQLKDTIRQCAKTNKRLYGICFGHQIIAAALGGEVSPIHKFNHNLRGRKQLNQTILDDEVTHCNLNVNFAHGEEVIRTPYDTFTFLSSDHCGIVGYQGDDILGMQFHPEYNIQILKFLAMKDNCDSDKKIFLLKEIDDSFTQGSNDGYEIQQITRKFLKLGSPIRIISKPFTLSRSCTLND